MSIHDLIGNLPPGSQVNTDLGMNMGQYANQNNSVLDQNEIDSVKARIWGTQKYSKRDQDVVKNVKNPKQLTLQQRVQLKLQEDEEYERI